MELFAKLLSQLRETLKSYSLGVGISPAFTNIYYEDLSLQFKFS